MYGSCIGPPCMVHAYAAVFRVALWRRSHAYTRDPRQRTVLRNIMLRRLNQRFPQQPIIPRTHHQIPCKPHSRVPTANPCHVAIYIPRNTRHVSRVFTRARVLSCSCAYRDKQSRRLPDRSVDADTDTGIIIIIATTAAAAFQRVDRTQKCLFRLVMRPLHGLRPPNLHHSVPTAAYCRHGFRHPYDLHAEPHLT